VTEHHPPAGTGRPGPTGGSPGLDGAPVRLEVLGQVGVMTLDDERAMQRAQLRLSGHPASQGMAVGSAPRLVLFHQRA
jgi:hypothetical protein